MKSVGGVLACLSLLAVMTSPVAAGGNPEDNLIPIYGSSFNDVVLKSDEIWAVAVLAPDQQCGEPCGKVKEVLGKLAGKMGHLMKFGTMMYSETIPNPAADDEMQSVGQIFNIVNATSGQATIPHLLVWEYGPKITNMAVSMPGQFLVQVVSKGPKSAWKQLRNFVPSVTETVNDKKLGDWLTAKEPTQPRVLLFTEKLGSSVLYKKLSLDFTGRAQFGEVSKYLEDVAEMFGVTEYPTLLVSRPGPLNPEDVDDLKTWKRYKGDLTFEGLSKFLNKAIPDRTVPLVNSPGSWKSKCEEGSGVCIIAALEEDGVSRARQMETFTAAVARAWVKVDLDGFARGSVTAMPFPVTFMFIDGERQKDFTNTFGMSAVPSVVAVNPRKQVYTGMPGSFNERNINEFVLGMVMGGEGLSPVAYDSQPHINTVVPTEALGGKTKKKKGKKGKKKKKKGGKKKSASPKTEL